jgi:hypothetical protein
VVLEALTRRQAKNRTKITEPCRPCSQTNSQFLPHRWAQATFENISGWMRAIDQHASDAVNKVRAP